MVDRSIYLVFGKKVEENSIDANFKSSVKVPNNGDYPNTFQPKVWLSVRDGGSENVLEDISMDLTVFDLSGN